MAEAPSLAAVFTEPWGGPVEIEPPKWPWPFDAIWEWLEDVWDEIARQAWGAAGWLWDEVWKKLNWLWTEISNALDYLGSQIWGFLFDEETGLWAKIQRGWDFLVAEITKAWEGFKVFVEEGWSFIVTEFTKAWEGFVEFVKGGWDFIVAEVTKLWTGLIEFVKGGWDFIVAEVTKLWDGFTEWVRKGWEWIISELQKTGDSIKENTWLGLEWLYTEITDWIMGGISAIQVWLQEVWAGIQEALGLVLQGFITWLLEHLTLIARMIMGAVNAVVGAVRGALQSLISGFLHTITGGMTKSSPPEEVETAVNVMIETIWERQIELIQEAYESPPSPEGITGSAQGVLSGLLVASLGGLIAGMAADFAHPIKQLQARSVIQKVVDWTGAPNVMASISMLPTEVGLLIPLRYHFNEMFQPMQPGATDIVLFAVRETFDEVRRKDLLEFYPGDPYTNAMARGGFSKTWAEHYWASHWILPSIRDLNYYLYRHDDFKETWRTYIRYHDYIPESIPWLEEVIYRPWTRVDTRRMRDLRIISYDEMKREYRWGGYDEKHAKGLSDWTEVYNEIPYLRARYQKGWLSSDELFSELIALNLDPDRALELWQKLVKADKGDRTTRERDLTKSEIVKGVKEGRITPVQGVELLVDMGYDEWEAWFILDIGGVELAGSPSGYWEMKKITQEYKRAQGIEYEEVPERLVEIEKEILELEEKIAKREASPESDSEVERLKKEIEKLEQERWNILQAVKRS